jgi:hypothetical protein
MLWIKGDLTFGLAFEKGKGKVVPIRAIQVNGQPDAPAALPPEEPLVSITYVAGWTTEPVQGQRSPSYS